MSGRTEIERALDGFLAEGPETVKDQALMRALDAIDRTNQRRGPFASWRFPHMNTYSRIAVATVVAVIAIGGALYLIGPRNGVGSPTAVPSPTQPAPAPTASVAVAATNPPSAAKSTNLDTTTWTAFTSTRYGYSAAYPGPWTAAVATENWIFETRQQFWSSNGDGADRFISSGFPQFHLTAFSSTMPAQTTPEGWIDSYINMGAACPSALNLPVVQIDGHQGRISANCAMAKADPQPSPVVEVFVAVGQTMFVFGIDDYDDVLLRAFLKTVKLPAPAAS
jgi:hypothetical protein